MEPKSQPPAPTPEGVASAAAGISLDKSVETDEFEILKNLGPKIVPLVVYKLARDEDGEDGNLCGVFLYNALENDAAYRAAQDSEDESPASKELLRSLSSRIVELNYQRNKILEERIALWVAYHNRYWVQSSGYFFTVCEEYWDLLEMGTSIIAPLMVEYSQLQWGYWFQLLHELIHGRQLGAHCYQKSVIFELCVKWFNEGDHSDAPLYIQTEFDQHYFGDKPPWLPLDNTDAEQP